MERSAQNSGRSKSGALPLSTAPRLGQGSRGKRRLSGPLQIEQFPRRPVETDLKVITPERAYCAQATALSRRQAVDRAYQSSPLWERKGSVPGLRPVLTKRSLARIYT